MKLRTLTAVARALAKRYGVDVRIRGATAHTDGRTIILPDLGAEPDEERLTLLRGYLDHEAGGHCRHTDFDVWPKDGDPAVRKMLNIIEDIRVEALLGREFSGCRKNLTELNARLFPNPEHPLSVLAVQGFRIVAGQPLPRDPDPGEVHAWFGADVFERVAACASTADCLALAEDLVGKLEEELRRLRARARRAGDGGEGEAGAGGQGAGEADASGAAGSSGSRDGGADSAGAPASLPDAPRNRQGEEAAARAGQVAAMLEALRGHKDKGARLTEALERLHDDSLAEGRYVVYSREEDRILPAPESGSDETYHALRGRLGGLNTLRWRIVQAFHSERAGRWVGDRDQGRINGRALAGIETGDIRVFKERVHAPRVNTAASFLVDCSASMEGERIVEAMSAVALFLESLRQAGAACEVLGYTTRGEYAVPADERRARDYGRVDKLLILVFKSFAEPFSSAVRRRIAGYRGIVMGWTCIVDPLLIAYERLAARPEPRRILFLLTDGDVASNGNDAAGRNELARVVRAIEREGRVELLAIDLMSGHTRKYFTRRIEAAHGAELAAKLLEGLRTHLFAGRRRALGRRRRP